MKQACHCIEEENFINRMETDAVSAVQSKEDIEMKKRNSLLIRAFVIISFLLSASTAYAEEEQSEQRPIAPAVWLEPQHEPAPWIDHRTLAIPAVMPEIIAAGKTVAIVSPGTGGLYAADAKLKLLGPVVLPENSELIAVDELDRIFIRQNDQLMVAQNWQEAADPNAYKPVLSVPDVRMIDIAGSHVVYADSSVLTLVDLNSGILKRVPLADFFNDEKVSAMTPEAVAASEKAKKKSSKAKKKKTENEQTVQVTDIEGIWWRSDGTGLIRIRSLLNSKTFATHDNGRSWELADDAPDKLVHSFGWIWDGMFKVLSRDGKTWLTMEGPEISPAEQLTVTNRAEPVFKLPENWMMPETPSMPISEVSEETVDAADNDAEKAVEPPAAAAVKMDFIPRLKSRYPIYEAAQQVQKSYTPLPTPLNPETGEFIIDGGLALGFFRNGTCSDQNHSCTPENFNVPDIWMMSADRGQETISLPSGCKPAWIGASKGLGILLCDSGNNQYTAYTRTVNSEWTAESLLPGTILEGIELLSASDGTIILAGDCRNETSEVAVMPTPEEMEAGLTDVRTEIVTTNACYAAVRRPEALGTAEIWRIERMENSGKIVPMTGGRMLSIEGTSAAQKKVILRTAAVTETVAENYDSSPYNGFVVTNEGCLALYDGMTAPEVLRDDPVQPRNEETGEITGPVPVRLLSPNGKLADLDCASSRTLVENGLNKVEQVDEKLGDDRYGLRAEAGGFFSTGDVKTWTVRIEALIPIFKGNYEVGAMYRMGGGNKASSLGHMGLVSIRWRYDNFEHFDFAVGAGIGYGSMCGYDESADPGAIDEDESTSPSGFSKCSSLSIRYMLGGKAAYKLAEQFKLVLSAEILGGTNWGFDLTGGLEIRF